MEIEKENLSREEESLSFIPLTTSQTLVTSTNTPIKKKEKIVVFRNIPETFVVGSDITVSFTVQKDLEITLKDWIGLYKVGWRSHTQFLYYDWSPFHEGLEEDVDKSVTFPHNKMPKSDGDFYQFCYFLSNGQLKGASTPFQFISSEEEEFVVEEVDEEKSEDGLMIIKSKKDSLQDQVLKEKSHNLSLAKKLTSVEVKLDLSYKREEELKHCLDEMMKAKNSSDKLNEEQAELLADAKQQNGHLQDCIVGMQERLDVLNQEKTTMERRLDDSDTYISSLQDKIKTLVGEKDSLQGKINSQNEENTAIKTFSRQMMLECDEKIKKMKACEMETSVQMVKYTEDLKKTKTSMAYLSDRLQNCEDKLGAAEHCKKMLNEEVVFLKDKLEAYEVEIAKERNDKVTELQTKENEVAAKEAEILDKDRQLEAINEQLREYDIKLGGSLVEKVKQHLEDLKKQLKDKDALVSEMKQEVDMLKGIIDEIKGENKNLITQLYSLEGSMFALETAHNVLLEKLHHKSVFDQARMEEKKKEKDIERMKEKVQDYLNKTSSSTGGETVSDDLIEFEIQKDKPADMNQLKEQSEKIELYTKLYTEEQDKNKLLMRKLAEQEEKLSKLSLDRQNSQTNDGSGDSETIVLCDDESFVDALNEYSVVARNSNECGIQRDPTEQQKNEAERTDLKSIRSCPFCPLVFVEGVTELEMTSHVESHLEEPQCPICQLVLPSKHHLIMHTETHFD